MLAPDELASYCLRALPAASGPVSEAAVRRRVTVTLAGLRRARSRREECVRLLRVPTRMARARIVRVLVRFGAGPTWTSGPPEKQQGWNDHAAFVDDLVARGTMVMGGPFADYSGSLIVLENVGEDEARALVARDPFIVNGVFVLESVHTWNVYVDELTPSS